jgi:outer membrane cobalamin receptor
MKLVTKSILGIAVMGLACVSAAFSASVADDANSVLQEVVVTATRQVEPLSKVPISVAVYSQQQMDAQGVKQLDDLVSKYP